LRVKITLSYDGSKFHGFQAQRDGTVTVANTIEKALHSLKIEPKFNASGRTDSGVHATAQVLDLTLPPHWHDLFRLKNYLNNLLYPHIHISSIIEVDESFHARYSVKRRLYRYLLKDSVDVFGYSYMLEHKNIDLIKLNSASKLFEGKHDFLYFHKSGSDIKSSVRSIYKCRFYKYKDLYVFGIEADGFLRSQIRMMLAFLLKINDNLLDEDDLISQLDKKSVKCRDIAPPNGLYLAKIKY
jgi:tRNA pseudouridine38-40 synthase